MTPGFRLVVLGHPGPHSDETTAPARASSKPRDSRCWLRGADDAALRWCYEHATVVLFPTLEEGFGFPLLEALTFGAPVIASTDPALVEVAAGSAQVVAPRRDRPRRVASTRSSGPRRRAPRAAAARTRTRRPPP